MTQPGKNKKKRIRNTIRTVICLLALAVVVLVIHVFTDILDKVIPSSGNTEHVAAASGGFATSRAARSVTELAGSLLPSSDRNQGAAPDAGNQPAEGEDNSAGNRQAGEGDEGASDPVGNTPAESQTSGTSHTMDNPQIDISSLDTSSEGWGPGTDCDEKNRPRSALSYQEKYGKYNANFIVPDSDRIYLTFDEGYENGCTSDILDILKEKNVKTVFFVTMQYVKQNPDLVQRMIDEGHTVGAHSVTHPADGLPSQTVEQQQKEITQLHDYVKENFDYEMHLFRFPAGIFSEQSLAIVNNCNYKSVFWSFAYLDYDTENQPDPSTALEKVKSRLHPGAIYLLHAVSTTNTKILGEFIDYIQAEGYEIGLFD